MTGVTGRCPECQDADLERRIGLLPVCPVCEWTGWSRDTVDTIHEPYDFSVDDEQECIVTEPNRVQVVYTVPVIAVVDLDNGTVDRVVVIDEEVELATPVDATPSGWDVTLTDGTTPVDAEPADRAIKIAESAEWPGWEFGF